MMKTNSVLFFLFFVAHSFAQDVTLKFPVNNYIYARIDNPINIITCKDVNEFTITAKGAVIEKTSNTAYTLKATAVGVAYINIYDKKSKSTQTIPVRIKPFPTPTVRLNRDYRTESAKDALNRSRWLETENLEIGCWSVNDRAFITFDLTVIHSNKIYSFKDQKNRFSEEIKSLFKKLTKDDLIVFYNIWFKATGEEKMLLNDLVYKLD